MVCNLFVAIGNYAFQGLIGRKLSLPEYGYANAAAGTVLLLSLPVMATSNALIHYVARFRASGRRAELHGLVSSIRKWLGFILGGGFLLALLLIRPLTDYCGFPRTSLVAVMMINTAAVLGTAFVTALCTGMGWYARIGLIAVSAVIVKLVSMSIFAATAPVAESAIAAAAVSTLVVLAKGFFRSPRKDPSVEPRFRNVCSSRARVRLWIVRPYPKRRAYCATKLRARSPRSLLRGRSF